MQDSSINHDKSETEKYHFTTEAIEDDITCNPILNIDMDDEITELLTPITPDEEFEFDLLEEVNYETNNPHITGLKKLNTFKRETVTFVETMTAVDQKIYKEAMKIKTYPFIIYLNFLFSFFYK